MCCYHVHYTPHDPVFLIYFTTKSKYLLRTAISLPKVQPVLLLPTDLLNSCCIYLQPNIKGKSRSHLLSARLTSCPWVNVSCSDHKTLCFM